MKFKIIALCLLMSMTSSVGAAELPFDKTMFYAEQHFKVPGNFGSMAVLGKDINLVALRYAERDDHTHDYIAFSEIDVASTFSAQCSTAELLQAAYEKIKTSCDGKSVRLFTLAMIAHEETGVITVGGVKHYYSRVPSSISVIYTISRDGKAIKITTNMLKPGQFKELFIADQKPAG